MKRFLFFCLLLCLPLVISVIVYLVIDPFKVVKKYEVYYEPDDFVSINRGWATAMHYINTNDTCRYNSFIFGNSRSIAYHEIEWRKYIPESCVCYHFDESGGSMGHLFHEIEYISKHSNIDQALLVLDWYILSRMSYEGYLFNLCPALDGNKNFLGFHLDCFKAFYQFGFFKAFFDYRFNRVYKPYMEDYFINPKWQYDYNPNNNELSWIKQEESIARGDYYDTKRMEVFQNVQFPGYVHDAVIDVERLELLKSIKAIFDIKQTDYRIVLSPVYDQSKIHPSDMQKLYDVFGEQYVYDFMGINKWTIDYHNYYEYSHYRPCVANEIMQLVYAQAHN